MTRPIYTYRLNIEYPEGVDWRNPPAAWEEPEHFGEFEDRTFHWPTERRFLSREGAEHRAELLRSWGCKVEIETVRPNHVGRKAMSTQLLERPLSASGPPGTDKLAHYWCIPCDRSRCGAEGAPATPPSPSMVRCVVCVEERHCACPYCGRR